MYGAGRSRRSRWIVVAALGAAAAALLAGCSPGADYPTVLDRPTPRSETLTPDQIKQATDALIADRDHLSAEVAGQATAGAAGAAGGANAAPGQPAASKTAASPAKP